VKLFVHNTIYNNIPSISWRYVLFEGTWVPGENQWPTYLKSCYIDLCPVDLAPSWIRDLTIMLRLSKYEGRFSTLLSLAYNHFLILVPFKGQIA